MLLVDFKVINFFYQKTRELNYKTKRNDNNDLEKSLVSEISESGYKMETSEILDHVIAIQLDKIERTYRNSTKKITETSEKAMENMIKLLEMRYSRRGWFKKGEKKHDNLATVLTEFKEKVKQK